MADYATGRTGSKTRLQTALGRFSLCADASRDQREREKDDLAFQIPENHWPEEWKAARKGQIVANVPIPPRPMVSIPKLDQTFQMLDNQMRAAHLGIQITAENEDADDATAEVLQDLYRHIETTSRAGLARNWAFQRAYKCGRGAYKIDKVYDLDSPVPGDQKIVIKRLLDQSCAYFDPFAQEPDFSDGRFAFEAAWMPATLYQDRFPDSKLAAMDTGELETLAHQMPDWVSGDDEESSAYLVAGYWCVHIEKVAGGEIRRVTYTLINAIEELEPETEWDGRYIPLIPVIGRELIPFDGSRHWQGVIGPAKDGQRLFDVAASNVIEKVGLDTKAPWIAAEGQDEGHETEWQLSAVRNFPMLTYKPVMVQGQLVPPPQKNIQGVNISGDLQLLQLAGGFIQDATTTVDQSRIEQLAKQRVAHQTIGSIASAGEQGRSDFLYNLVDITLPYEAKVVLDLIPKVYDRPGRVVRVRSADGKTRPVMVNMPHVVGPGGKPIAVPPGSPPPPQPPQMMPGQPPPPGMPPPAQVKTFDLSKGAYGVVATVGKGFATKSDAQAAQYAQLFQADPQVMPAFLPFFLRAQDFPQEAVDRAEKMVPPQLRDQPQQDPKAMQAQMSQMQGVIQQLQQQLQQAGQIIQTEQVAQQAGIEKVKIQEATAIELQRMKDATQIAVAKIQVMAKGVLADREMENEQTALHMEYADYERDRQHEQQMARGQMAHDATMDDLSAQRDQQVGQQEHERERQATGADRAHEGVMAQMQGEREDANADAQRAHEAAMQAAQAAQEPEAPDAGA